MNSVIRFCSPFAAGVAPKSLCGGPRDWRSCHRSGSPDELHANLRAQYQPADSLEELWVEKIAAWTWRLRGQIARSVAGHRYDLQQSRAIELENPELSSSEMDAMIDHLFLPSPDDRDKDKLLRYEAMISRQLSHVTSELER